MFFVVQRGLWARKPSIANDKLNLAINKIETFLNRLLMIVHGKLEFEI